VLRHHDESIEPRVNRTALLFSLALLTAACSGGGAASAPVGAPPAAPPTPAPVDISVLMMGNSHTAFHNLPDTLAAMVRAGKPGRTVSVVTAPGWLFLDERLVHAPSMAMLGSQRWSFVILQAQKYSSSGLFTYSTVEAEQLIGMARTASAVPILFPEWPRLGVDETQRIYDLHASIAQKAPACVAPIGQAWDRALARYPGLTLHDPDGNHSAPAGSFLAALVLYATVTGNSPATLPMLPITGVDVDTQDKLRFIAAETVLAVAPRALCPSDPV
jgi:hypothetical protein